MTGPRLPDGFAVQVDRRVQVLGEGSALLGGSPTRLLRLAPAAQTMLTGRPARGARRRQRPACPHAAGRHRRASAAGERTVTSRRDCRYPGAGQRVGLRRLVATLRGLRVIVVDDGSAYRHPDERLRGQALRYPGVAPHPQQGPRGGAQHRPGGVQHRLRRVPGLRRRAAARVAGGAAGPLLRPRCCVGRAAHRGAATADNMVARYEAVRSSLDLGLREAPVVPYGTVSYVPSAAIICRRSVLSEVGGFDETLSPARTSTSAGG